MRISVLPDTIRIDLSSVDAALWGGITAVVRPLGVEEFARWVDAFPGQDTVREAAGVIVKQQLVTVEPVDVGGAPFDPANPVHFRSVFALDRKGLDAIGLIYTTLVERAQLGDVAEKNSDSPSGSDTQSSLAT